MFPFKPKKTEPSHIDKVIDEILDEMKNGYSSEDSIGQATVVKTLTEAKALEARPNRVSADAVLAAAASLAGIAMIIGFEKSSVLTSKGLSFVLKPRS